MLNAELLNVGYAKLEGYHQNTKHLDLLRSAESQARIEERGVWQPANRYDFRLILDWFVGIGTVAAAVATFLTVCEMRIQRKSSYRPSLVIAETAFIATLGGSNMQRLPFSWKPASNATDSDFGGPGLDVLNFEGPGMDVLNFGTGVARQVKYTWNTDFSSLITRMGELLPSLAPGLSCYLDVKGMLVWEGDGDIIATIPDLLSDGEIEFVLPYGRGEDPVSIEIPISVWLTSALILIAAATGGKATEPAMTVPIILTYYDTDMSKYSHSFNISFRLGYYRKDILWHSTMIIASISAEKQTGIRSR
jgi:hypothetical protein